MTDSKVVIVTGGTFGIGREISLVLADRGHRVVAFGLDTAQTSSTADESVSRFRSEVEDRDLNVHVLEADVSDATAVEDVVKRTMARHNRIDALVNNAAIGPLGTVLDTDEALFDSVLSVNLKGPYLCSRAVLPHMAQAGGGAIVNIGSGAGYGKPNMAVYAASKGGLLALSSATAYDFFPDKVRVNTVIPGGGAIMSGMTLGRVGGDITKVDSNAPGSAAGRPVEGTDIANAVSFLISDEAETISGTVVDVGCFAHQGGSVERKKIS